ncbi:MAG: primosomal protein N', partial [Deltaproteobacteria bacterium]|nr:primosomal protein N' [Deltaproteobacteria bacterium]
MAEKKHFLEIAVPLPIRKTFVYEIPPGMPTPVPPGQRVLVPFGRRILGGIVIGPAKTIPEGITILPVRQILDDEFSLPEKFLSFLLWVAHYYMQPIGEVLKTALPSGTTLHTREVYSLTEEGLRALASPSLGDRETRILRSLKRRGSQGSIPGEFRKDPSFPPLLAELIGKGLIRRDEDSIKQKIDEKLVTYIVINNNVDEKKIPLTLRQREALDFIREKGEVALSEFNQQLKASPSIIARLKNWGLIKIIQKEVFRRPSWEETEDWMDGPPRVLMEDQKKAIETITQTIPEGKYRPFLLFGVTGSGKTEVYLRVIEEVIARGRQALILVPEIALTAQMVAYFRSRINCPLAVLHSGLSEGERFDEWRRIKRNLVKLVIGARSGIFAPLSNLGIIIVDEEHDPSYKQEEKVRYHARDLALVRGKMENALVVLGSATPSMESYYNTQEKKIRLLTLPSRIDHRPLAQVQIVDM